MHILKFNPSKKEDAMNALKLGMVTAMIAYTMACLTSAAAPRKPIKEWFFSVRWDYLLSVCPVVISVN